ncbi:MAG: IS701 family transposase [Proteobacteria bacterium]|nr:IS701 family transposase [Pseudomonadota bacterium]
MPTAETARADRFAAYVNALAEALGHRDRHEPLRAYVTGLCLPGERKSIEPMAARVDPRHVQSRHQSMHHFVADAPWAAAAVLRVARDWVLAPMARHGAVAAWIVDDTAFPKKGQHSVGVARQYCGVLGKQDNCQVAVSVSIANEAVSLPVAYQLYLPETWAKDRRRRRAVGVPDEITFQPKWQIALGQIQTVQAEGVPPAPVVADAGYGDTTAFRDALTTRGLAYAVGVKKETTAWPPGEAPRPPKRWKGRGRPPTHVRRTATHTPQSLKALALGLSPTAWRTVTWREGTRGAMRSRFAQLRVRPAHRDEDRTEPRTEEWLLIEWPRGDAEPTKYWLSTLPTTTPLADLVRLAKLRWRIERDYQELKDELGLDHFEGRGWRGFHHHGALCIAAYAYLAAERARLSPPAPLSFLRAARLPKGFTPRGAPGAA